MWQLHSYVSDSSSIPPNLASSSPAVGSLHMLLMKRRIGVGLPGTKRLKFGLTVKSIPVCVHVSQLVVLLPVLGYAAVSSIVSYFGSFIIIMIKSRLSRYMLYDDKSVRLWQSALMYRRYIWIPVLNWAHSINITITINNYWLVWDMTIFSHFCFTWFNCFLNGQRGHQK
jgi:hypothetical protein